MKTDNIKIILAEKNKQLSKVIGLYNRINQGKNEMIPQHIRNKMMRGTLRTKEISDILGLLEYRIAIINPNGQEIPLNQEQKIINYNYMIRDLKNILESLGYQIYFTDEITDQKLQ